MNAPLTSLRTDPPRASAFPLSLASSPVVGAGQGAGAALRSADLFGQLLRLPIRPPAAPPRQEPLSSHSTEAHPTSDSQPSTNSDATSAAELTDEATANEVEREDESDTSAAAETAAALAVAANETRTEAQTENDSPTAEIAVLGDAEEGTSTPALADANAAADELASEQPLSNAANTGDPAANNPTAESDELGSQEVLTTQGHTQANSELHVESDEGTEPKTSAGLPTTLAADNAAEAAAIGTKEADGSEADIALEHDPVANPFGTGESASTQEREAKGDRRQRGKWYEQEAGKSDQTTSTSVDRAEQQPDKQLAAELRDEAITESVEAPQLPPAASQFEENPMIIEGLASSTALAGSESWLAGASTSSELPNGANSNSNSLSSELGDGAVSSNSSANSNGRSVSNSSQPGAVQPGDSADLTQQEKIRLIQRVTRSFSRLGVDGGQINLRLHPPQLGSLNVQVRLEGRSMTAKLTTETGAARDAILESLPILKGRLAEQGFEISQFQVEVANNDLADASLGGNAGDQAYDQEAYRQPRSELPYNFRSAPRADVVDTEATREVGGTRPLRWQTATGIDIQA